MADVLSSSKVFSLCENRSGSFSHKKRDFSSDVRFSRPRSLPFQGLRSCSRSNGILGKRLNVGDLRLKPLNGNPRVTPLQMTLAFPKALKWWKKGLQPNMKEIESAEDLVGSLKNAGNRLVIVDFFSPGCGGCRALHPKLCQFAEKNPDVLFLQVNYEQHKSMCYSLNVHVLPFFRFYRGANGRLCSFSCTNATIKKFKDALAKHTTERCSLGPAKGLDESELLALAANKDLSFTYTTKSVPVLAPHGEMAEAVPFVHSSRATSKESEDKTLASAGR